MLILKELWKKEVEEPEVKNSYRLVLELRERLEDTLKLAHTELQRAQLKGKHYYHRKTKVRELAPRDKVLTLVLLQTDHNKLLMQWKGPLEVSGVVGLNDYKVRVRGKERVYHANLLKKYFEREDAIGVVAVETNANTCKHEHIDSEIEEVDPVSIFWRLAVMSRKSQSRVWPSERIFLKSKEQSLQILQMSFKACSQKPQAQQLWLSIMSSSHLTNQLDQDHIQYRIA